MGNPTLDTLYFNNNLTLLKQCVNTFENNCPEYRLKLGDSIVNQIIDNPDVNINQQLFQYYSDNLRKGIDTVFFNGNSELADQLRANVTRFAAYKAYHATSQIRSAYLEDNDIETAKTVLHKFNRYQAAEYNTAVARARTAKQWQSFNSDRRKKLFPNIEWIRTRSADPRERHLQFVGLVLPKDHTFWILNQPGNLWNCKCDWHETNKPEHIPYLLDVENTLIADNGLLGNPGITGEVFDDRSSYLLVRKQTTQKIMQSISDIIKLTSKPQTIKLSNFSVQLGNITFNELSKEANGKAYFIKQEIARNLKTYEHKLNNKQTQEVDTSNDTPGSDYEKLKKRFVNMESYSLKVSSYSFIVTFGVFKNGNKYLFSITEK